MGSSPARSTGISLSVEDSCLACLQMGVMGLVIGGKTITVCNLVQSGYTMVIDPFSFTSGGVNSPSICTAASSCKTDQKSNCIPS